MTATLDPFETALMHELRAVVSERQRDTAPGSPQRPRRLRPSRWAAVAAAAAGVAAVATSMVLQPSGAAFAVTTTSSGDVVVNVNRLDDADALEAALAQVGVTAQVHYAAAGLDGSFDPANLPVGSRRYIVADCMVKFGPQVVGTDTGFRLTIPAADVGTAENLDVTTTGTSASDADVQVVYGNRASGCLHQSTTDGWVAWRQAAVAGN